MDKAYTVSLEGNNPFVADTMKIVREKLEEFYGEDVDLDEIYTPDFVRIEVWSNDGELLTVAEATKCEVYH